MIRSYIKKKFKNHPSLKAMKNQREKFSFKFVSYEKVLKKTKNLGIIKSHHQTNILLKIEKKF